MNQEKGNETPKELDVQGSDAEPMPLNSKRKGELQERG